MAGQTRGPTAATRGVDPVTAPPRSCRTHRLPLATGPSCRRSCDPSTSAGSIRTSSRRPRTEHQRVGTTHRPRPGRHGAHARVRRGARRHRRRHAGPSRRWRPHRRRTLPVGQIDHVVSAGCEGDGFEPRHTTHGFRYVRIEGHPHRLTPDDVTGIVVHTDLRRTGWFRCSDERINRLHEIADWSFRDNVCAIPTDCPQRERSGWTGDWQVFLPSAAFLYDVAGFSLDWLRDLAAEQRADGRVRELRPGSAPPALTRRHARLPPGLGRLGATPSSWSRGTMSRIYRDGACSETGRRWCDGWSTPRRRARANRSPERATARADPAPHEAYLWDTGFHWGEWLEPGGDELEADQGPVATVFLAPFRVARGADRPVARARPRGGALRGPGGHAGCVANRIPRRRRAA